MRGMAALRIPSYRRQVRRETAPEVEVLAAWIVEQITRDEDPARRKEAHEQLRQLAAVYRSEPGYAEWWA